MPKHADEVVAQLTKKLVDDGQLIEAGWVLFKLLTIPPDAPPAQVEEMRNSFFAGAQHLFGSLMNLLDDGSDPTDADMNRMDLIATELEKFAEQLRLRLTRPQGAA